MDGMKNIKESLCYFSFYSSKNIFSSEPFILIILKEISLINLSCVSNVHIFGLRGLLVLWLSRLGIRMWRFCG